MSIEVMLAFLSTCSLEEKLGFKVVAQCAPVLKGVKVSNLITVKPGICGLIKQYLGGSQVICTPLYSGRGREILFLYRYDALEEYLMRPEVRRFLAGYGYLDRSVSGVLIRLRKRYADYVEKRWAFPHELGVILEYPVEDVEGFIRNGGKNCLTERYWKVYHNRERAEEIFRQYDMVKEMAMREIVSGRSLSQVVVSE